MFSGWKSGEQDVRAVCQLPGREITNSFLSEVGGPGLLLPREYYFMEKELSSKGGKELSSTEFASYSFASIL